MASRPSEYLVAMPKKAATSIQNRAPGPPAAMAEATPTMLPVPMVAERAVHRALKLVTLFVLDHELQGLAQVSHLEEPDPEGQPHAAGDDQNDQRYAPDGAVNGF